jgi:SAM-dependent methyltransferase
MMLTAADQPTTQDSEWFASWFDSIHYHKLYAHRDDIEAAGFVDRLIGRPGPRPWAHVLDLGCGAGRHSRYLASRDLRATGMDLSAGSIREAKKSEQPRLRFLEHDMRVPFGRHAFDYVFNFFTSFGYFDGPAEHLTVVRNIASSLKDGGGLVLDYLNVRHAEARLAAEEVKNIDGVIYRLTRWTDTRHFYKRIVVEDGAVEPLEYVEPSRQVHASGLRAHVRGSPPQHRGRLRRLSPRLLGCPGLTTTDSGGEKDGHRNGCGLLARKGLADAAERLGGHAEVRREHPLRHAERDQRIRSQERLVPLVGRGLSALTMR